MARLSMVRVIVLLALVACLVVLPTAPYGAYREGRLVYYGKNVMERVYQKRIAQRLAPAGWTGVLTTSPYCEDIGDVVRLSILNPHTRRWSAYEAALIVDCSQPADKARHIAQGLREVGYPTAQRYQFVDTGVTKVRVIK